MAASVLFACGLNEQKLPSFVHISEESNVDGSFLISSILGQRLRISNAGTVLVCLQHNYQHYFHAGMRLGYNANIFNGKTLHVVDPLTEIARNGITCKWLRDERRLTLALLDAIRDHINTSVTQRISTTVLIDNLAILLNLGATKEEIILLCHDLAELPKQYENLTVITKMSNCDLYEPLDNNVAKLGTLRIRAAQLKSGVSRDVDGKLLIEREVIANGGDVQQKLKQSKIQINSEKRQQEKAKKEESLQDQVLKKDDGSEKTSTIPRNEEIEQDAQSEKTSDEKSVVQPEELDLKKQEKPEEQKHDQLSEMKSQQQELEPPQKKQQKEEPVIQEEAQEKYDELKQELEEMETQEHDGGYAFEVLRKEVLYKVNDRSIKILSPGEVGVRV